MKKIGLTKLKYKLRLSRILLLIFVLIIAGQLFTLHRSLYMPRLADEEVIRTLTARQHVGRIDFDAYRDILSWVNENREPGEGVWFQLVDGQFGRENPFAEY